MRRLLLLLLPLALLCACTTAPAEQADAPFSFYYRCAEVAYGGEDGVIRAEAAPLEADADLRTVVLQYLKGPASPELRTPLPADWALESIGLTEGTAELVFSGIPCRSLDRTILNACLARTLLQLPGVQRVPPPARKENPAAADNIMKQVPLAHRRAVAVPGRAALLAAVDDGQIHKCRSFTMQHGVNNLQRADIAIPHLFYYTMLDVATDTTHHGGNICLRLHSWAPAPACSPRTCWATA